jgi:hypothetical protein
MLQPIYKYLKSEGWEINPDMNVFKYPVYIELIKGKYLIEFSTRDVPNGTRLWVIKYKDNGGSWKNTDTDGIYYGVLDSDLDYKNVGVKIMEKLKSI